MKYYPRIVPHKEYFTYEYWWVTNREIVGARLMKVRIPPLTGPCSNESFFEFYCPESGDSMIIYGSEDIEKFLWVDYIHEPDVSAYDYRSTK